MTVIPNLHVYVAVCEAGSIAGGARTLGVPRPTVSRQIRLLEDELGVRLLHRTGRTLVRTPAGEELYARGRRIVDDMVEARSSVALRDGRPRGTLRVSTFGQVDSGLAELIVGFSIEYPEVRVEVEANPRFVDLVRESFDVAIRGGELGDTSLVARRLFPLRHRLYASEAYLSQFGRPQSSADLAQHQCLVGFEDGRSPRTSWPLLTGGKVDIRNAVASNSVALLERAVTAGRGIAMLPWAPVGCTCLLEDDVGSDGVLAVVYPARRLVPPKVRAFVDYAVAHRDLLKPK